MSEVVSGASANLAVREPLTEAALRSALREVMEPDLAVDVVSLGMIDTVRVWVDQELIVVGLVLPCFACPIVDLIIDQFAFALDRFGFRVDVTLNQKRVVLRDDMSRSAQSRLFSTGFLARPPSDKARPRTAPEFHVEWFSSSP